MNTTVHASVALSAEELLAVESFGHELVGRGQPFHAAWLLGRVLSNVPYRAESWRVLAEALGAMGRLAESAIAAATSELLQGHVDFSPDVRAALNAVPTSLPQVRP